MPDFELYSAGRIVRSLTRVDVFYEQPVPIYNFTKIDSILTSTLTSGIVLLSTFPVGIDLFNRNLGVVTDYDLATSGNSRYTTVIDTNLRRVGVAISGAVVTGRR